MNREVLFSDHDKKMIQLSQDFYKAQKEHESYYLDADDWADLANWYANSGKSKQAFEIATTGLHQHPRHTGLLVEMAYLYLADSKLDQAQEIIDRIEDHYLPEVKILKANLLMDRGEESQAEELLQSIDTQPEISDIIEIAHLFLEHDQPQKAWPWLEQAKGYEESVNYMNAMALYYAATGEYDKAIQNFDKLLDINPYSAHCWAGLARVYIGKEEMNKAIDAADFAIVADEEFGAAYLTKAIAYAHLGNVPEAKKCYRLAHQYGAVTLDICRMYDAYGYIEEGDWEQASEKLVQVLEMSTPITTPRDVVLGKLAFCQYKDGRYEDALQLCKMAEELNPDETEYYFTEAAALLAQGKQELCADAWEKAIDLDSSANSWVTIGQTCEELERADLAKVAYQRVEQLDPSYPELYEHLAINHLLLQDKDEFLRYNALCTTPLSVEQVKKVQMALEETGSKDAADKLQDIIEAMK